MCTRPSWRMLQTKLVDHGFLAPEDASQDYFGDQVTAPTLVAAVERLHKAGGVQRVMEDRVHLWDVTGLVNALDTLFCGVEAADGGVRPRAFGSPTGRWGQSSLTFSINTAGCNLGSAAVPIIAAAFAQWEAASRGRLTLTKRDAGGNIQVRFGGASVDPKFGRPGGVSGSAWPPSSGDIRFDSAETWSAATPAPLGQVSLLAVALHEIGHALGIAHSNNPASLMYPFDPPLSAIDAESIEALQSIYGWRPQRWLSDRATLDRPALGMTSSYNFTSRFDTTYMVWRGSHGDDSLWWSRLDGDDWTPQQQLPNKGSSHGPALNPNGEKMLMAWKGVPGDSTIYYAFGRDGDWTDQQLVPNVGTSSRPGLAGNVMAWKGIEGDTSIWWATLGPGGWSGQKPVRGVGTSDGPALAFLGNRLFMFWKGIPGDSNAYWSWMDPTNDPIWRPQQLIQYTDSVTEGMISLQIGTSNSLSATTRDNEILLAWKGIEGDSGIWFATFDGNQFSGQVSVPDVGTSAGPSVLAADGSIIMAWKGSGEDTGIYWSKL
jgi:Matrixin